jgi:uncharacterized RDD family membrane protein YckC
MFCPACGNNNVPGSVTCNKCGATLPASHAAAPATVPSPAPVPTAAQTPPASLPSAAQNKAAPLIAGAALAGMGDRAIATILDLVVMGAAFALVGMWAAVRWGGVTSNGFQLNGAPAAVVLSTVATFAFLYLWLFEGVLGATLGKFILNVRVRRTDGSTIGLKQSLVRNLLRIIDGFGFYLVGFLTAIFSHLKQRLGDHVAKTVVVQKESGPLPRAVAVVVWVAVIVSSLVGAYRLHAGAGATGAASAAATTPSVPSQNVPTQAAAAGEGRVTRAELGTDRTPDFEIVNPSSEFYTDTPKIMCVWTVKGVDPSVPITVVWIVDDSGGAAPPNYKIMEKSLSGAPEGSFALTSPSNGWPAGKYHVEIYIGDKLAKQVPFSIKQR